MTKSIKLDMSRLLGANDRGVSMVGTMKITPVKKASTAPKS